MICNCINSASAQMCGVGCQKTKKEPREMFPWLCWEKKEGWRRTVKCAPYLLFNVDYFRRYVSFESYAKEVYSCVESRHINPVMG